MARAKALNKLSDDEMKKLMASAQEKEKRSRKRNRRRDKKKAPNIIEAINNWQLGII